jgi:hypothetical protein
MTNIKQYIYKPFILIDIVLKQEALKEENTLKGFQFILT